MFDKIKNPLSFLFSIFLVVFILTLQVRSLDLKKPNPYPISWDIYGYYLYLPATFIYNDLGLENDEWINNTREKYHPSSTFYQVAPGKENRKTIVYNVGYSFIFLPGFIVANLSSEYLGFEKDGYSKPYQISLLITALLFSILGIYLFRKISLSFFSDKITTLLMCCILLGTNYFFQITYDGVMPHNFLFTINCLIILYSKKWNDNKSIKTAIPLGLLIGFATLCRPTEILWIIIPLMWGVFDVKTAIQKITYLLKNISQAIVVFVIVFLMVFIQFIYYKYSSGSFFVLNLHDEGFSFLSPYISEFLFSYKKGWLLYTPVMVFGIIGFYFLKKENLKLLLPFVLFFILNIYVASSWECWWYASSFSQRPMVESYPMMILPMGYFLSQSFKFKKYVSYLISTLLVLVISLNIFQTYQYKNGIITGETMTKEYYWKIFGKTKKPDDVNKFLAVDRYQNTFSEYENYRDHFYKKEVFYTSFEKGENTIDTISVSGQKSFLLNNDVAFSPAFEQDYYKITHKSHLWVRASVNVFLTQPYTESNSCIVVSTENKGKSYKYVSSNYDNFNIKPNQWTNIHLDYLTPYIRYKHDKVKVYFWNMGSAPVLIDDFKIEVFEPIEDYQ